MQNGIIQKNIEVFGRILKGVPELVYVGEKSLRENSEVVVFENESEFNECLTVVEKLKGVLLKYREITNLGRGVAAPQIGVNKKVFITYVGDAFQIYINPEILEYSDSKNFYRELCMSSTVMSADVKRSETIKLRWIDENKAEQTKEFSGFEARLLQHEYDHLLGIVNLDCCEKGSIEFVVKSPFEEKIRHHRTVTNIYIDGANLKQGVELFDYGVDYEKLYLWLKKKYKVHKVYLFLGYITELQDFYESLKKLNFILIFRESYFDKKTGTYKANCDAELILQCLNDVKDRVVDKAVLVSGDGDYACLVDYLQRKKILRSLIAPNFAGCSIFLKRLVSNIIYIENKNIRDLFCKNKKAHR